MSAFNLNRSLLNPKFEGYRFSPLAQEQVVIRNPLLYKPSQTNVSGRSHVTFQEVQSRISHNHLTVSQSGHIIYVDKAFRVVSVGLDRATLAPTFSLLYELPKQVLSPEADVLQPEYASAAFLDTTLLLVSDGHGYLYALRLSAIGHAELIGTFDLSIPPAYGPSENTVPFRIHQVALTTPQTAVVILSSKHYTGGSEASEAAESSRTRSKKTPLFDIWAVQFDLPLPPTQEQVRPLEILWHRRGRDVPVYTYYDSKRGAFLLVGGSRYHALDVGPAPSYEPSADEMAPIPRAGENLDSNQPPKPPPYSWTQNSDSVTVAIPLPSSTATENIRVAFTPRTLTVLIREDPSLDDLTSDDSTRVRPPRFDMKALWGDIQPSTSVWTWDRAAERKYGILTIHIDKAHEDTRWSHVFAAAGTRPVGTTPNVSDDDVEVPETLDPSELWAIREALEKYTAALRDGQDASGLGLGKGVPSLAKDEMDDELDVSVGRPVCLTWVRADGSQPPYGYGDDAPVHLLSTALPGLESVSPPSLVIKHGLDGVLYELTEGSSPDDVPAWRHTATYSALSFVLASKRDTRFTHHVSSQAVLAFESGSRELGGNVYVYRGAPAREKWAKQTILKVGGSTAGSLLGLGVMTNVDGKVVILSLCEEELVVLRDVL